MTDAPAPAPSTAWGLGLATLADDGTVLDVWFPEPVLGTGAEVPAGLADLADVDDVRGVRSEVLSLIHI